VPVTDPPRPQPTPPAAEGLVERIAALFGAFGAKDVGVPVAELARRTGLPRSTTHRLVDQLVAAGLLERDGSAVTLGLRMFELGQLVPQQLRVAPRSARTCTTCARRPGTPRTSRSSTART
jgi:DNA-binding IclR family transcriptional regulator